MKNEYGTECYTKIGNIYRYDVCVFKDKPFYGKVSLANATEFTVGAFFITDPMSPQFGRLFVAIENAGRGYTFSVNSHPSYVSEKLGIDGTDADAMADWIESQFVVYDKQYHKEIREEYI